MTFELFPEQASTTAKHVDWLYWSLTGLSAVIIALVFIPLVEGHSTSELLRNLSS